MDKLKILRIITRLNIGGPAIHTILLTKEIDGAEFESVLMSGSISGQEGDMGYLADNYNVKPVYVPAMKRDVNPIADIAAFWQIYKFMKRYKPYIVHTHTAKAGTLGRLAAIFAKVPVKIHTFHGNSLQGYFGGFFNRLFIFAERMLARFTDGVVVISEQQKKEIVDKYRITDAGRCRIIKLGFELEAFLNLNGDRQFFRTKFALKDDDALVGIIGRLVSVKNHRMFIDAANYIKEHSNKGDSDKIKFIIVGDGEMRRDIAGYIKAKGLEKQIFFAGWVKDMTDVYAGLDIVVLTSINEGTPVSLIEAMACAKPVIATDVGGVRDALGGCGILVQSNDYVGMGRKILELSSSPEKRAELGSRGRKYASQTYSKDRLVSELKDQYKGFVVNGQDTKG